MTGWTEYRGLATGALDGDKGKWLKWSKAYNSIKRQAKMV